MNPLIDQGLAKGLIAFDAEQKNIGGFELKVVEENELTRIFKQAHDALWAGGKRNPSKTRQTDFLQNLGRTRQAQNRRTLRFLELHCGKTFYSHTQGRVSCATSALRTN